MTTKHESDRILLRVRIHGIKNIRSTTVESIMYLHSFPATPFGIGLTEFTLAIVTDDAVSAFVTLQLVKRFALGRLKVRVRMVWTTTVLTTGTRKGSLVEECEQRFELVRTVLQCGMRRKGGPSAGEYESVHTYVVTSSINDYRFPLRSWRADPNIGKMSSVPLTQRDSLIVVKLPAVCRR